MSTRTFTFTGAPETWVVPEGITQVEVSYLFPSEGAVLTEGVHSGNGLVVITLPLT